VSLRQNQSIFAKQFAEFIVWLYSEGYEVTFGEAQRTEEMADIYVKKGLSSAGRKSLHLQKLAFDIFIFKNGDLLEDKNALKHIGEKWESIDSLNSWGGFFTNRFDYPHFSRGIDKPERTR
jgi:peptidoglycan L-alanyl-D-glutamate endopeptidase CwlK